MGSERGFLEIDRVDKTYAPVEERIKHYKEFAIRPSIKQLESQGARCMDCGIPYCHAMGCPLGNLIPEWNDLVYKGQWKTAYERLSATSEFPEFTGRICPAPCETSCTMSINSAPVTIQEIELAIIERAFKEGWVVPEPPTIETGKRVAVIGSGPAGLTAASKLRKLGHEVTVFEKSDRIGGLMRYGIPEFKLEKKFIDRRLEIMKAEGVRFETEVSIGEDISADYLRRSFDAILIAVGAGKPRDIPAGGRGLEGIYFAMEYLTKSNKYCEGDMDFGEIISARDKNVLVIGGGDTGSDCVGTAIRQGARSVKQIEIMPKPQEWNEPNNPYWPDWPKTLRTSTSHKEGCERDWGIMTSYFTGMGVNVQRAYLSRVEWAENKFNGRMEMKEIPGSEFDIPVELVLIAAGFVHLEGGELIKALDPRMDPRGNVETNGRGETSIPGVFAAGDAASGASLVVRAMESGRIASESIHEYLLQL
ncbi:MAG: glutamate synthase subunit beta [Spirochaetales bacterium]|uniref:Glutamate synthase subunit beta n=1 Tax=Candidatus Thalassospirochaeta sargassi TaxID=3119039 RepID=A0AAJ1IFA3_9SPIO|nr:glutamate synthase subunit beta [Spirochaetales bacterium]